MEIEEFKLAKAKEYRKMRESYGIIDPVYLDEIEDAYYKGIDFAIERFKEWLDELWQFEVEQIKREYYDKTSSSRFLTIFVKGLVNVC